MRAWGSPRRNVLGVFEPISSSLREVSLTKIVRILALTISSLSCWDGVSLDTPDHHVSVPSTPTSQNALILTIWLQSHVRYLQGTVNPRAGIFYQNGNCPSTHPIRIPLIFLETIWDTKPFLNDWPTDGSQPLVYSMGDP